MKKRDYKIMDEGGRKQMAIIPDKKEKFWKREI